MEKFIYFLTVLTLVVLSVMFEIPNELIVLGVVVTSTMQLMDLLKKG